MAVLLCMPYRYGGALLRIDTRTTGALWTGLRSTTSKMTKTRIAWKERLNAVVAADNIIVLAAASHDDTENKILKEMHLLFSA